MVFRKSEQSAIEPSKFQEIVELAAQDVRDTVAPFLTERSDVTTTSSSYEIAKGDDVDILHSLNRGEAPTATVITHEVRHLDLGTFGDSRMIDLFEDQATDIDLKYRSAAELLMAYRRTLAKTWLLAAKGNVVLKEKGPSIISPSLKSITPEEDGVVRLVADGGTDISVSLNDVIKAIGHHQGPSIGNYGDANISYSRLSGMSFMMMTSQDYTDLVRDKVDSGASVLGSITYVPIAQHKNNNPVGQQDIRDLGSLPTIMGYPILIVGQWDSKSQYGKTFLDLVGTTVSPNAGDPTNKFDVSRDIVIASGDAVCRAKNTVLTSMNPCPTSGRLHNVSLESKMGAVRVHGEKVVLLRVTRTVDKRTVNTMMANAAADNATINVMSTEEAAAELESIKLGTYSAPELSSEPSKTSTKANSKTKI